MAIGEYKAKKSNEFKYLPKDKINKIEYIKFAVYGRYSWLTYRRKRRTPLRRSSKRSGWHHSWVGPSRADYLAGQKRFPKAIEILDVRSL
jgi:hypothetical protein